MLCNKNKTGAIFKTHLLCLSRRALFEKDMFEKHCTIAKSYW